MGWLRKQPEITPLHHHIVVLEHDDGERVLLPFMDKDQANMFLAQYYWEEFMERTFPTMTSLRWRPLYMLNRVTSGGNND